MIASRTVRRFGGEISYKAPTMIYLFAKRISDRAYRVAIRIEIGHTITMRNEDVFRAEAANQIRKPEKDPALN